MRKTFRELIADNKRKSMMLLVFFFLFTVFVVMMLTLAVVLMMNPEGAAEVNWTVSVIAGLAAMVISFLIMYLSYFRGDRFILAVSGAKEIEKRDDPQLFNVVEEVSIAAGVPMPKVYLIEDSAPNAFATGRDPEHGIVAITTGLREKLNREELQGVMAHEMAHIRHYDIRLMMLMAVLIGSIVMLSDFFWRFLRIQMWTGGGRSMSGGRRGNQSGKGGGGGAIVLIVIVVAVVLSIIAPILARIIQLAISRQREYLADAGAVELTRNPTGLANALRKLDSDPNDLATANGGTAHLFIVNPFRKMRSRGNSLFATHPPLEDRIARLEALAK